ncbi:TLD family protein [Theileria parva strain Muguga]|uniref:TLD family protein n=1 Tax=Theileria parva strain Muguga TaxID=333668 RepID=UPI001C617E48|nr:TLD family protein [Theileria parva strain Muguga]EAN31806.2 TLD family protein [Theileria parva strain Muguga]
MDSNNFAAKNGPDESDIARTDDEISYLVNADVYKKWRSQYVDEIELSVWTVEMVTFSVNNSFENYGSIKTAIRRGVPDIIKHFIWIKANDADHFYFQHPDFYKNSFASTFGHNVPSELGDYCPTFSGGILGLQADILDSPLVLENLHQHIDQSLESEVVYDSESEYNYWINPYKESPSYMRNSSSVSVSRSKSGRFFGNMYSRFINKFRSNSRKSSLNSNHSVPYTSSASANFASSNNSKTNAPYPVELEPGSVPKYDTSSSFYSVQNLDFNQSNQPDVSNRDRLIDYIHLLNYENLNKRELMKSALRRIRRGTFDTKPFARNLERSRQLSDTFIYNSKYKYFPPRPSHHSKLIHRTNDFDDSDHHDNPFYTNHKPETSKSCFHVFCLPICRSKPKKGETKNVFEYIPLTNPNTFNTNEPPFVEILRPFAPPLPVDTSSTADRFQMTRHSDNIKSYISDSGIEKYVNRATDFGGLPMINTIPEHISSNSFDQPFSQNASSFGPDKLAYESHLPYDSRPSSLLSSDFRVIANTIDPESSPDQSFNNPDITPTKNYEETLSNLDVDTEDIELVTNLSANFTQQIKSNTFEGSVYKLSDVTDFTVLLSEEGVLEVKRVLWCLNSYFSSHIEFLPVIPSLCCLLLMYLAPSAALCVLYQFMKRSIDTCSMDCGSRFFFIDRRGFVRFVTFILSVMVSHLRKTVLHLRTLKVDLAAWVARSVQTGFSQILPFDYIVRIYGNFLFEGEMVLLRYSVALIKCIRLKLMECTTKRDAEQLLYHIGLDPAVHIDKVTKVAYSLRIKKFDKRISSVETPSPYLMNVKIRHFYRPRLHSKSCILSETNWEFIWFNLKPTYRILDPRRLYCSNKHGNSMTAVIKRITEHEIESSPALLFIKTTKLNVLGVFIPTLLNNPINGHFTIQDVPQVDSFVFTLAPNESAFNFSGKNKVGVKLSKDNIVVGAKQPAFIVDGTLSSGFTAECESYDSPPLLQGNRFSVYMIEIWTLS